jgi:serine/threonine-protein kinase
MVGKLGKGDSIVFEYEVLGLAGVGATSYVYKCRPSNPDLPETVAVKVLHNKFVYDREARRQFLAEAQLMGSVDHPNVVKLLSVIETPGLVAFVMEHVDGPTLQQWQAQTATSRTDEDLSMIFTQILGGLGHAHDMGVIHRDLKPANIMIAQSGGQPLAKIIDFGVARRVSDGPSRADFESIRGTVAYISPDEIRSPHEVCPSSDLYSLGVMLYELAAGTRPFTDRAPEDLLVAHLSEDPLPPTFHNPNLNPELAEVILRTLAKRPKDRYADCTGLMMALEQVTGIAKEIRTEQWARPTLPAPSPEFLAKAQLSWRTKVRSALSSLFGAFFNPGVTGAAPDPHYLSRPHMDVIPV